MSPVTGHGVVTNTRSMRLSTEPDNGRDGVEKGLEFDSHPVEQGADARRPSACANPFAAGKAANSLAISNSRTGRSSTGRSPAIGRSRR